MSQAVAPEYCASSKHNPLRERKENILQVNIVLCIKLIIVSVLRYISRDIIHNFHPCLFCFIDFLRQNESDAPAQVDRSKETKEIPLQNI